MPEEKKRAKLTQILQRLNEISQPLTEFFEALPDGSQPPRAADGAFDMLQGGEWLLGYDDSALMLVAYVPSGMSSPALSFHVLNGGFSDEAVNVAIVHICEYAFEEGAMKVKVSTFEGRSQKLLEELGGFRRVGVLEKEALTNGVLADIVILEKLNRVLNESIEEEVVIKQKGRRRKKQAE